MRPSPQHLAGNRAGKRGDGRIGRSTYSYVDAGPPQVDYPSFPSHLFPPPRMHLSNSGLTGGEPRGSRISTFRRACSRLRQGTFVSKANETPTFVCGWERSRLPPLVRLMELASRWFVCSSIHTSPVNSASREEIGLRGGQFRFAGGYGLLERARASLSTTSPSGTDAAQGVNMNGNGQICGGGGGAREPPGRVNTGWMGCCSTRGN